MKILALKNNNALTLILGNRHYNISDSEKSEKLFSLAMEYKKNPSEDILTELQDAVAPISRVLRKGLLEEDNNGKFYLPGTKTPMPEKLSKQILDFAEKGYPFEAFINFWKRCLLNPNKQARKDFYSYCDKFGAPITDKGYAVLYKSVRRGTVKNDGLIDFIGNEYSKVKRWKKSPAKYAVFSTEDGYVCLSEKQQANAEDRTEMVFEGNLDELFNNIGDIQEEGNFTPIHHGGDYGNTIRLGVPVTMPREECDPDINNACSYGLHVGHVSYVNHFGYGNDIVNLACLVSPTDVVALPEYDHSKIRVCRYLPYSIVEKNNGQIIELTEESYWEEDFDMDDENHLEQIINFETEDEMLLNNDEDIVTIAEQLICY